MRVRLLAPHVIGDVVHLANEVMDLPPGVAMAALDPEAAEAIALERRRVFPGGLTNGVEPPASFGGPGR